MEAWMTDWIPIEDLHLSVRASTVLKREGVTTADELVLMREGDLSCMRDLGQKTVEEIKAALAIVGLSLWSGD
jgi:DNA-directed RNA polymerase subunit alpha